MNKIQIAEGKTLKLQNALIFELNMNAPELEHLDNEIGKMNTYITTHGSRQVGPLIQYSDVMENELGEMELRLCFLLQSENFIHQVESPYRMESVIRVTNCLYAHYTGPEEKIKFAYDKLGVYAFEQDINLKGNNYTIFVSRDDEAETIVADIFMETAE